jgi:hypothetical protein
MPVGNLNPCLVGFESTRLCEGRRHRAETERQSVDVACLVLAVASFGRGLPLA